jgi:DNA-directed RNA polymerase specialized sigma24 family protein
MTREQEFHNLMLEHQSMVFSIALRILCDRSAAEEVAQDVFLELHAKQDALTSAEHVRYWLRRVTVHRSIDQVRRRDRRPTHSVSSATGSGYGGGLMKVGDSSGGRGRTWKPAACARHAPSRHGLDEKAVAAVKQYKFKPAMYKGHAVAVALTIEVNFRIY